MQKIARLWSHFASSPHPKASLLRVDTRDAAIAESGVTTLDRVAVSDKKKGMIYIKVGSGLTSAVGRKHFHWKAPAMRRFFASSFLRLAMPGFARDVHAIRA